MSIWQSFTSISQSWLPSTLRCCNCTLGTYINAVHSLVTILEARHSQAKSWASKQWIKFLPTPSYCPHQPIPQHRRDDITFETDALNYLHPHPEICTSIPGNLYQGTDYIPRDTVRIPPDTGWQHQQHTRDTKQPIQAGTLGNPVHAEIRVYLSPWYRVGTKAMFISKGT